MKLFNKLLLISFILLSGTISAQDVQMADTFYAEGKIYIVVGVIAIIFIGIAVYLFTIDRKLKKLEDTLKDKK